MRVGASSDLLIGDLLQYSNFIDSFNRIMEQEDILHYQDIKNEMIINPENFSRYFFRSKKELQEVLTTQVVKDFNLSEMKIEVKHHGLNLFDAAEQSNYYFTNLQTKAAMKDNLLNENLTADEKKQIKDKMKEWEEKIKE